MSVATPYPYDVLRRHAEHLEAEGLNAAKVFRRAMQIQQELRDFETPLALTEVMQDSVYSLRPSRLRSDPKPHGDGIGL
jgi:hypothetical protein